MPNRKREASTRAKHQTANPKAKAPKPTPRRGLELTTRRGWPGPEEIEREIDQRIAAYEASINKSSGKELNLIALGDSWFDYPVGDIDYVRPDITFWLQERLLKPKPHIARIAHWGDKMDDLLGAKKVKRLRKALKAGKAHAILFSGGGNDIIGDKFLQWLNEAKLVDYDPARAIDEAAFQHILATVADGYRTLVAIRNEYDRDIPIFVYGYDFARPTNVAVVCKLTGPWLFPALELRGWMSVPEGADLQTGCDIVKRMLQRFDSMLRDLAANSPNVFVVTTQGTIKDPRLWENETHLRPDGFKAIAECFVKELKKHFPPLNA